MNRYAQITTRKGTFVADLSRKDDGIITILAVTNSNGKMEKLAEIPFCSRLEVIKAINRVVSYLEATADLKTFKGLKLLIDPETAVKKSVLGVAEKPAADKRKSRASLWGD